MRHAPFPENSSSHWKAASLLGAVLFSSFIYFYEGGGWNQNSRFDLLRAIVERHTLQIDAYHRTRRTRPTSTDITTLIRLRGWCFWSLPFALAARPGLRAFGRRSGIAARRNGSVLCGKRGRFALPDGAGCSLLVFSGLRFGASVGGAAFATVVMGLGTPMWAYAGLFWAHALVGAVPDICVCCCAKAAG